MNSTTHVRLFLCELETEEDKFYLGEEEIVRVDIIGTVVYISQRERVTTFQIDDGTGIIHCAKFTSPESEGDCDRQHSQREKGPNYSLKNLLLSLVPPENPLKLGDLVNVRGRLNIFRDQPQIIVNSLRHVHDVNEEWFRVLEINALRKSKAASMNNAKESDMESKDITNIESILGIRKRARDVDHAARTKRRSLARDARRVDLDDIVKKLQVPSREELLVLAEQLKKQKELGTLQRLRLGLVSDESISAFLDWNGALYAVVGCLTGQDASLQREAACTLINLALGSEKQCLDICQKAGVYLVMHISNNNPQLQDPCAWCIGNLCGTHKSVCQLLQRQGAEDALVKLLESYVPHVTQSAAYALMQYLTTMPERIEVIATPSMVTRLIEGLGKVDEGIADVGWCLFTLSTRKEVCCVLVDNGIIQAAFNNLEKLTNQQSLNVSATTSLIRVVLNCVGAVPGASVEVYHRSEQLVSVTKALLYSPHPHLRTETLHMLSNVINAVSGDTNTGQPIVNDLNLKASLETAVRSALAARFTPDPPNTSSFHCNA